MSDRAIRRLAECERERARDDEGRRIGWSFLYILFAFKIATVGIIWFSASATRMHDLPFIIATTWYWLLIPAVGIAGPLLYRWRLWQVRRRRDRLRNQEWMQEHQPGRRETTTMTVDDILEQRDPSRR